MLLFFLLARGVCSIPVLGALVVACAVSACAQSSKLPSVQGHFVRSDGTITPTFSLEVCATDAERSLGLMYRRSLPENGGMIFVFSDERDNTFWMKNTYIPLDMVFVDRAMKVVGILEDVPPLNEAPRSVGAKSMYVLEFSAGTMKKQGVTIGSRVVIAGTLPQPR
jgi:uncharacterized membrane protein (UPF0127 family)